ncbi:hypothetical protein A8F94_06505 [Bacillus sp. FJAT-27225]|uniref:TadE/TadG family type IV pilus assembly protein n=1 Tax=Bacillus sp. FJAT-27225 TaxID=1743144 RepID=UPI00080C3252|nr:TadE/TadG family type IV pilus assembly protein [Bacillus sp. FJAT-27225]OCA87515.1 hypothetical protein A8F94_06505 [Bacillus sp. FJAT-27225]
MTKILKNEDGNVLVIVAVFMIAIFGFTAMVVDAGGLFLEKSKLQKALDSAVLAGGKDLLKGKNVAVATAINIAGKNGVTLTTDDIETGDDYIKATKTISKNLTFARVLGFNNSDVYATAKARISRNLVKRAGIVPVAIPKEKFPDEPPKPGETPASFTIHFQPGNSGKGNPDEDNSSISGNFGFLEIGGSGGNVLENNIKNGVEMEVSDNMWELTKTGLSWGNVKSGFQYRIDKDKKSPTCNDYSKADATCGRVVIVPMVESYEGANGKTLVKIIGFASIWLDKITGHDIQAKFISTVTFGEFEEGEDFGVVGVRLVE